MSHNQEIEDSLSQGFLSPITKWDDSPSGLFGIRVFFGQVSVTIDILVYSNRINRPMFFGYLGVPAGYFWGYTVNVYIYNHVYIYINNIHILYNIVHINTVYIYSSIIVLPYVIIHVYTLIISRIISITCNILI